MSRFKLAEKMPSVAYVLEPRFPGGTSSAVAAELEVVSKVARVQVYGLETGMFTGRDVAPQISDVLRRLNIPLHWTKGEVAADLVIFHNPSCLKFLEELNLRIIARHVVVVTHENFLRPGGALGFDVDKCLALLAAHSIALKRSLAPVSAWNRSTVETWLNDHDAKENWSVFKHDWFNICAFDRVAPNESPSDRRGRHSRPGLEKFPSRRVMEQCFPETAQSNVVLGGDLFLQSDDVPGHWTLHPFGALSVERFFDQIDFMVYFTAPTWRESFGRVIVEAIAAGKIVITDPETARSFDGAAIAAEPDAVDGIIAGYVADAERYIADVVCAQDKLSRYSAQAFGAQFDAVLHSIPGETV
ncbi:MAG: glycosyltransferase [Roseobacter sp.]